jgi:integrase
VEKDSANASTEDKGVWKASWSADEIKKVLRFVGSLRNIASILFLASSGCRVGALVDMRLKHLMEMPLCCKAVTIYEGAREEYVTFLTPEASKALDDYFNERRKDGEQREPRSLASYRQDSSKITTCLLRQPRTSSWKLDCGHRHHISA